jgi:hypothetical protein
MPPLIAEDFQVFHHAHVLIIASAHLNKKSLPCTERAWDPHLKPEPTVDLRLTPYMGNCGTLFPRVLGGAEGSLHTVSAIMTIM